MADQDELIYEFLDREGVSKLSKALLTKVNSRIQQRIVPTINDLSDNDHVPSARAVYNAINKMSHIKFKTHTGNIGTIVTPNPSYIYLQRDSLSDTTWMMYVYDEDIGWINVGDTEVDLSNYWSKNPDDVEALKLALGIPQEIEALKTSINDINNDMQLVKSKVFDLSNELNNKVDKSQMVLFTDDDILSAVDEAYLSTMPTI